MCGIIGRLGKDNALPYLMDGLKKLEYRGYDSAGVAVLQNGEICTVKAKGKLNNLTEKLKQEPVNGFIGIGHTRWATHGEPSEKNAHPHKSANGKFSLVHNGIIENSSEIKRDFPLIKERCVSDTDTEVAVQLLQHFYEGDVIKAICMTQKHLKGSYALGILCSDTPNCIYCTARSSPLNAALCEDGGFIASDVSAFSDYASSAYSIADGEICVIKQNSISFFNKNGIPIKKDAFIIDADASFSDKQGYEHYMLLEIMQQPEAVKNTLLGIIKDNCICFDALSDDTDFIKNELNRIVFVACGSAYHVCVSAKAVTEELCKIPCSAEIASEFRYASATVNKNTLAVFVSQSGETADTFAALRLAKQCGAKTLSVVNVKGSAIATESDRVIYTRAGREIAVATTKAYSAQLSVMYALSVYFAKIRGSILQDDYNKAVSALNELHQKIQTTINSVMPVIKEMSLHYYKSNNMFFIGRQLDYATALEASLKMKEVSYVHSEAYPSGELKHGTISLIEKGTPVIAVAGEDKVLSKTAANVLEVISRGADTVIITEQKNKDLFLGCGKVICVEDTYGIFIGSLTVLPLQLFAYFTARLRGCDIDMPKNLAKSVTVE